MRGRPKLPETDRKSDLIRVRVSPEQKAALTAAAARAGFDEVSAWLRDLGLRHASSPTDEMPTNDEEG